MDNIAGIDFEAIGLGTLLEREWLKVPLHQREYSWEQENVEDLFKDLGDAVFGGGEAYFLGTIVLTAMDKEGLAVVDGQQRLATTTILFAAIRDYFIQKGDEEMANIIEGEVISRPVRRAREREPKLTLNVDDNSYFKARIIALPGSKERKKCGDPVLISHRLLDQAATLAEDRVKTIVAGAGDAEARLQDWIDFIKSKAVVIVLRTTSKFDAYKMFETLNDRGLETSQADMLKSMLFDHAESSISEAQQKWSSMRTSLEGLGDAKIIKEYLRHLTLALYGPSEEREFYKRIEPRINSKTRALEFIRDLAKSAEDYAAMLTPSHSKWNTYSSNIPDSIQALNEFGVKQIRPLMLAVATRFTPAEADKSFRAFVRWTVRFLIVGGMRGQRLEDAYAEQAQLIMSGKVTTHKKLRENLDSVLPSDPLFTAKFATATVSVQKNARYYLRAMEAVRRNELDCPELSPVQDTNLCNLEHILPERPSNKWPHIDSKKAEALFKRIGNMVLLNAKKNTVIGNADFQSKRQIFAASPIMLTQDVATGTDKNSKWDEDSIDQRQLKLAQTALKTWPL